MSAPWQTDMLLAKLAFTVAVLTVFYAADLLQRRAYAAYKDTFILFYADWCGHCKTFMPEWSRFEASAARDFPDMKTIALESSSGNATGALFDVNSFPTLIYVDRSGRRHDYSGPRSSQGLLSFLSETR